MNNIFQNKKTFAIVTGKKYALQCLQEAYANGLQYRHYDSAEQCPFELFFKEYPEPTNDSPKLTFRFSPYSNFDQIGWADDQFYSSEFKCPVYRWEDICEQLYPQDINFLDLL